MRQDSETNAQACEGPAMPCLDRRSLLKAAAAAAPMIATLPCGAAVSLTSAAQCIVNDQALRPPEVDTPATPGGPQDDTFVRYMAWQRRCGRVLYYYVTTPTGSNWYKADVTSPPPHVVVPSLRSRSDVKVYVLVHWIPTDGNTNVTPDGFYPLTKLNASNMGITASCMTSITESRRDFKARARK